MEHQESFPRFAVSVTLYVHAISGQHAVEIARVLLDYSTGAENRIEALGVLRDFALPAPVIGPARDTSAGHREGGDVS